MSRVIVLLDALSLSLRCTVNDCLREEGEKFADGAALVEGEAREVVRARERRARAGGRREDDGDHVDLHGGRKLWDEGLDEGEDEGGEQASKYAVRHTR